MTAPIVRATSTTALLIFTARSEPENDALAFLQRYRFLIDFDRDKRNG